jgi:hypothetical protein
MQCEDPSQLLSTLCEPCTPPAFTAAAKNERIARKMTMESQGENNETDS